MTAKEESNTLTKMQVQLAEARKDITYQGHQLDSLDKKVDDSIAKQDLIIEGIAKLAFVPVTNFEEYKAQHAAQATTGLARIEKLENFIEDNRAGILLAQKISNQLVQVFVYSIVGVALIAGAVLFIKGAL